MKINKSFAFLIEPPKQKSDFLNNFAVKRPIFHSSSLKMILLLKQVFGTGYGTDREEKEKRNVS